MTQTIPAEKTFNTALFIGLGVVFWATGILFVRFAGAALFVNNNPWLFALFAVSIPISWGFIKIIAIVGQVSGNDLLRAVSLSSLAAALLDGTALTWFPSLYGLEQAGLMLAAAWLLYALGVGLAIGCWASR